MRFAPSCSLLLLAAACADSGGEAVDWFADRTADSGLAAIFDDRSEMTAGVAVADVDGDELLDILVAGGVGPVTLLANRGGLAFVDATRASGLATAEGAARSVALVDVDDDGDADALLGGADGVALWTNDGAGRFTAAVDAVAGARSTLGLLPTDVDGDGAVDLVVLHDSLPNSIWRGDGAGGFALQAAEMLAAGDTRSWAAAAIDHRGDGDVDLYIGHDRLIVDSGERPMPPPGPVGDPDQLLDSDNGQLVDVGGAAGVTEPRATMGIVYADFTGDGLDDLFLTDYGRNDLLAARPDGGYDDVTVASGLAAPYRTGDDCPRGVTPLPLSNCWNVSWGAAFEDFDGDGRADLVVANSHINGDRPQPAQLWRQDAAGQFAEVDAGLGWAAARGLIAADFDRDGDVDLLLADRDWPRLWENRSDSGGRTLAVQADLGARVTARLASGARRSRLIGTGGVPHSFGPPEVYLSGGDDPIESVEIRWPDGRVSVLAPPADGYLLIAE